jgi:hypothetical protein
LFRGSRLIVGNLDPIPTVRRFRVADDVLEARVPAPVGMVVRLAPRISKAGNSQTLADEERRHASPSPAIVSPADRG